MEKKKFIIMAIILFLVGGMGTFVFASRPDSFDANDINYSKEPTYQKVDTPSIDNDQTSNDNTTIEIPNEDEKTEGELIPAPINPSQIGTSTSGSSSTTKKPVQKPTQDQKPSEDNTIHQPEEPKTEDPTKPNSSDSNNSSSGNTSSNRPSVPSDKDTTAPTAVVTTSNNNGYKKTFRDITVTITADEKIKPVEGWQLDDTEKVLTKTFDKEIFKKDESENLIIEDITEYITITDLAGNTAKIEYEIKNYDPTKPEVIVSQATDKKGNTTITITEIYNRPLSEDESWTQIENGDYIKVVTIENENSGTIIVLPDGEIQIIEEDVIILLPDGTIQIIEKDGSITTLPSGSEVIDNAFKIDIKISNHNENNKPILTNKPVLVTIQSNREILDTEEWKQKGWNISEDNKTLQKEFREVGVITETIRDLAENEIYINQNIENIDMIPANITKVSIRNGNIEIRANDFIKLTAGWKSDLTSNIRKIYKPISEFSDTKEEIVTLEDMAGNLSRFKIKLNDNGTVEYELIN